MIMRNYNESVDRIDNSVARATVWHHKALPSDGKQLPLGQIYLSAPQPCVGFLFLAYLTKKYK